MQEPRPSLLALVQPASVGCSGCLPSALGVTSQRMRPTTWLERTLLTGSQASSCMAVSPTNCSHRHFQLHTAPSLPASLEQHQCCNTTCTHTALQSRGRCSLRAISRGVQDTHECIVPAKAALCLLADALCHPDFSYSSHSQASCSPLCLDTLPTVLTRAFPPAPQPLALSPSLDQPPQDLFSH